MTTLGTESSDNLNLKDLRTCTTRSGQRLLHVHVARTARTRLKAPLQLWSSGPLPQVVDQQWQEELQDEQQSELQDGSQRLEK